MGYGPDISRLESPARRDCEVWDHLATTQDKSNDPKHQRTNAGKEKLSCGWRIANFGQTGDAAAVRTNPEDFLASQLIQEHFSLWENLHARTTQRDVGRTRQQTKKNLHRGGLETLSQFVFQHLLGKEQLAMARKKLIEPVSFSNSFSAFSCVRVPEIRTRIVPLYGV